MQRRGAFGIGNRAAKRTRRDASRRALGSPIWLAVSLLASACGRRTPVDEVVYLADVAPVSPDPRFAVGSSDFKLSRLLYAPLVSVDDEELEPRMELAESVRALDDLHYEVTLRDARFSD